MNLSGLSVFFLAGYVAFVLSMNGLGYMIAIFYERKFDQATPKNGFLVAIGAGIMFAGSLFIDTHGARAGLLFQAVMLVAAGIASVWNAAQLYLTMKKESK